MVWSSHGLSDPFSILISRKRCIYVIDRSCLSFLILKNKHTRTHGRQINKGSYMFISSKYIWYEPINPLIEEFFNTFIRLLHLQQESSWVVRRCSLLIAVWALVRHLRPSSYVNPIYQFAQPSPDQLCKFNCTAQLAQVCSVNAVTPMITFFQKYIARPLFQILNHYFFIYTFLFYIWTYIYMHRKTFNLE